MENRLEPEESHAVGSKLLLTEEQWLERMKERKQGQGSSGTANARRRAPAPRKKGGGGGSNGKAAARNLSHDKCRNCGRYGHWAKDCRSPKKAQAYLAQGEEEDEPALLMAQVCALSDAQEPPPSHVHLDEPRAQVHLATNDDGDHLEGWYFDTGATNHMTGRHDIFAKLDRGVVGSVRFGDGSVVDIRGCGTILFAGKNGEHKALSGVYFIPRLKNNIISVGQLEEGGSKMLIEDGILWIWDR